MSSRRFSPLMDPLVLETEAARGVPAIWDKLPKINWNSAFFNFILPFGLLLIVAFSLKGRYDKKKKLYDEYLVV